MKYTLTQKQRLVVALIYILLLALSYIVLISIGISSTIKGSDSRIWFYSGALLVILGTYITEPYFTKPSDVIVNSISAMLAMLGISNKESFQGYTFIMAYSIIMLLLAIIVTASKDSKHRWCKVCYIITSKLGQSKVIFSLIYLAASYSFFGVSGRTEQLVIALFLWITIVYFDFMGLIIKKLCLIFTSYKTMDSILKIGHLVSCKDQSLYEIELDSDSDGEIIIGKSYIAITRNDNFFIGVVVKITKSLDSIYALLNVYQRDQVPVLYTKQQLGLYTIKKSVFHEENTAYLCDQSKISDLISQDGQFLDVYNKCMAGYITNGSNVNVINFVITNETYNETESIGEGTVLEVNINKKPTLYQVINGITKEEIYQNDSSCGYIVGVARKLGFYDNEKKELNTVKWIPQNYTPVVYKNCEDLSEVDLAGIAERAIGRLPNTDHEIHIRDINSLVTHNTAILGILGIGKSCLAYELIKKVSMTGVKIICIDITNQYYSDSGLLAYIARSDIQNDIPDARITDIHNTSTRTGANNRPDLWGNEQSFKGIIDVELSAFLESDKKVLVINPDIYDVTKPASMFNITTLTALTVAEKTRVISERLLQYSMRRGQSDNAKYLIIYEEAHSLIPEWNSAANSADQSAANGTARVILQGRKYGLGCFVITQRTANVSKSILNQCNTVFALRIFDDTGKSFLENYIGKEYSNILPVIEERHAIAMGKGMKLKQPVIIQLNDSKYNFLSTRS